MSPQTQRSEVLTFRRIHYHESGVYQIIPDAFASFKHILSEFVYYLPAAYHFYAAVIYDSTKGCIRIRLQIRQLYIKPESVKFDFNMHLYRIRMTFF